MAAKSQTVLEGVNVLEFALAAAGPLVGALLSDYGATVVHVETRAHVDILRTAPPFKGNQPGINRSAYHANYNRGKYGVTLSLGHPRGVEMARRLVAWCDVLVENMTPGVMAKWGLDYAGASKMNARVIMLSMSQWGQTGPLSRQKGYGRQAVAASGFGEITGWPEPAGDAEKGEPLRLRRASWGVPVPRGGRLVRGRRDQRRGMACLVPRSRLSGPGRRSQIRNAGGTQAARGRTGGLGLLVHAGVPGARVDATASGRRGARGSRPELDRGAR